jgi:GT2 family glycosyltransferase
MLIKREVLEKVGLLPEEYFFGMEEYDFSLTVKKAGYKLYYVPQFESYHWGDGSHSNYDPKYVYNNYRSKLIFQEKFLPKGVFPLWKLVFILYGRYSAKRVWRKLREEDDGLEDSSIPFEDLDFAFARAIADHGTDLLTEESLDNFQNLLNKRRNGVNKKDPITNGH